MPIPDAAELAKMTPMMTQYYDLRRQAGEAILFFRMGDFYELFGDDAERVAPRLELVLTSREKGNKERIPFCGVPHHSARKYWVKLLKMGFRVAIADQTEKPGEVKGLVRREIVRTLSPGCVDDLEVLERDQPNYLMAFFEEPGSRQLLCLLSDVSTGEIRLGPVRDEEDLAPLVERFRPSEILVRRFYEDTVRAALENYLLHHTVSFANLPEAILRDKKQQGAQFRRVFGRGGLKNQPCGEVKGGLPLVAAVLNYLESMRAGTEQFLSLRPLQDPGIMIVDEVARRDLELFETVRRRTREGSLLREVDRTLSPMGARLLRYSLAHPLMDAEKIRIRQDAVAALLDGDPQLLTDLRGLLRHTPDLERLLTRVLAGHIQPAELAHIRSVLVRARQVLDQLSGQPDLPAGLFDAIGAGLEQAAAPGALLTSRIPEAPGALGSLDVFIDGYDAGLDEKRSLALNGEQRIRDYEAELRAETGIGSLKVRHHKTFGLLIEVTKSNLSRVPESFIRRQTMVNNERFVTPELQELGESLVIAREEAVAREEELYAVLVQELRGHRESLRAVAAALADLDLLQGFAWKAREADWQRPRLSEDRGINLRASRHPVVERFVGAHDFVPNDISMPADRRHLLITGPNMAGKSTVMRQTALAAILHQAGSWLPADEARLPLFDRIFTRVGAADDLALGQSTFMVEMAEAASILRQATPDSLVILDEVGRGTSTGDGMAIAAAILEEMAVSIGCSSMFATHYHQLVPLACRLPGVATVQTEVLEKGDRIEFTHRLIDGASGRSFGIEVARLAGIPVRVIEKARSHLEGLEKSAPESPLLQVQKEEPNGAQASTRHAGFSFENDDIQKKNGDLILERLNRIKIHRTTPLQALNVLNDLKALAENPGEAGLFTDTH